MTRALLMASGGIDSTVLAWQLRDQGWDIATLHIDFGHPALESEHRSLEAILNPIAVPLEHLTIAGAYQAFPARGLLPGRNLLLLAAAGAYAAVRGFETLAIGLIRDEDERGDSNVAFLASFETAARMTPPAPKVIAPLLGLTKSEVVRLGRTLEAPLHMTSSCYAGVPGGCHECTGCWERTRAMRGVR